MKLFSLLETSMIYYGIISFILAVFLIISIAKGNKKSITFTFIALGVMTYVLLGIIVQLSYFAFIIIVAIISTVFNINNFGNIIANLMIIIFFAAWEMAIFSGIKAFIKGKTDKKSEFIDTYTKKGAIEFDRWKKFEAFIEDYTLIKDKEATSVVVLGKYLSYSIALGINKKCDKELQDLIDAKYSFNDMMIFNILEEN